MGNEKGFLSVSSGMIIIMIIILSCVGTRMNGKILNTLKFTFVLLDPKSNPVHETKEFPS